MKRKIHSSYLTDAVDAKTLPKLVRLFAAKIKEKTQLDNIEYTSIAFRGMSGALVAPLLAIRLRKGLLMCRKESENSHGGRVEGDTRGGGYIIVDDFTSLGTTIRGIVDTIAQWQRNNRYIWAGEISPEFTPRAVFFYRSCDTNNTISLRGYRTPDGAPLVIPTYHYRLTDLCY
jgi:hypothetical protein